MTDYWGAIMALLFLALVLFGRLVVPLLALLLSIPVVWLMLASVLATSPLGVLAPMVGIVD